MKKCAFSNLITFLSIGSPSCVIPRETEGTEREAQGVGRDMLCPRKLFFISLSIVEHKDSLRNRDKQQLGNGPILEVWRGNCYINLILWPRSRESPITKW